MILAAVPEIVFIYQKIISSIPYRAFAWLNNSSNAPKTFIDIEIPENVETIAEWAFYKSTRIASLTFHSNLRTIDKNAFEECGRYSNAFKRIDYVGTFEQYISMNFANEYSNPSYYSGNIYINGELLTGEIAVPEGCTDISVGAFANTSITSISLPSTLEKIGVHAFYNCNSLESIYIDTQEHFFNVEFGNLYSNPLIYSNNLIFGDGSLFSGDFVIQEGVKAIPSYAFMNNELFDTITLPSSVETIGEYAFYGCTAEITTDFTSDELTIGDYAFYGCTTVDHVTSTGDIKSVGDYAFYGCENLESFVSQGSIENIGEFAFNSLENLTTFSAASGGMRVGARAFSYCINLENFGYGDGLVSTGDFAFYQCHSLKNVAVSENIESFGYHSFSETLSVERLDIRDLENFIKVPYHYGCEYYDPNNKNTGFYSRNFPDVRVGSSIYVDGKYLTDLVIPEGVTELGKYMFRNWSQIISVHIPSTLRNVEDSAFLNCSGIQSVYAPSLYDWMQIEFGYQYYTNPMWYESHEKTLYIDGEPLTEVRIPEGITQIKDYTFENINTITDFYYPETVTYIGDSAFLHSKIQRLWLPDVNTWIGCTANNEYGSPSIGSVSRNIYFNGQQITELVVPDGVERIGAGAFSGVITLQSVYLPDSVTSLGEYAFSGCTSVTSFRISNNLTTLPRCALSQCPIDNLYIPAKLTSCGYSAISGAKKVSFAPRRTIEAKMFYHCRFEEIELPSALYYIRDEAISSNTKLKRVIVPGKVKTIGKNAFKGCYNLEEITIPTSVTSMGDFVFSNCDKLTDIYYPGTQSQWNSITFGPEKEWITSRVHFGANCMVKGHNVSSDWTVNYATLTTNGEKFKQCSVCTKHVDSVVLEKPEITLSENAPIVFDNENMLIRNFPDATGSIDSLFTCSNTDVTCVQTSGGFGTGTQVKFTKDGEVVSVFTITVPGDMTGDGYIDAFDVAIASEIINTFEDPENPAYFAAMDMFSDGYIDAIDLAYINYIANFEE